MKKLSILTFAMLVGSLLTACSIAEPSFPLDEGNSVTEEASSMAIVEGTDVPNEALPIEVAEETHMPEETVTGEAENEVDDAPQETTTSDNSQVSWDEAIEFLKRGDVKLVSQSHNLEVSLVLDDGRTVTTVEPSIDAIFEAIAECDAACSNIVMMTE